MIWLPRETKSKHIDWTLGLKGDHQVWPWPWHWPWIFEVKYGICYIISQPKVVWLPWNEKQTYWLNFRPQMWPSGLTLATTLTLNFQGPIWNLLYLNQKSSDCHETKSKHWLNSRPQMWPVGLTLAMTLTFEFSRSDVTLTFDQTHVLAQGFSWSNFKTAVTQNGRAKVTKVSCKDLPDSDRGDFWCRHAVDSFSWMSQCWPRFMLLYGVTMAQLIGYMTFMNSFFVKFISNFQHSTDMQNLSSKWSLP